MKTIFVLVSLLLSLPAVCRAADSAIMIPIGFSRDAHIFAFQEYGVQDGSGFGYANIYFIDTESQSRLAAPTISVRGSTENSLAWARREAWKKAQPFIDKYRLFEIPAFLLAYNATSEVGTDPHALAFFP